MRTKFIFMALLLLLACAEEKQVTLKITPIYGGQTDERLFKVDESGRVQSTCIITKTFKSTSVVNFFSGNIVDLTWTTEPTVTPATNVRDGMATFTIYNDYPTTGLNCCKLLWVWVWDGSAWVNQKTIAAGGFASYKWTIPDCASGTLATIVKRYKYQSQGCYITFRFQNGSWTNGHLLGSPTGASFQTGNAC